MMSAIFCRASGRPRGRRSEREWSGSDAYGNREKGLLHLTRGVPKHSFIFVDLLQKLYDSLPVPDAPTPPISSQKTISEQKRDRKPCRPPRSLGEERELKFLRVSGSEDPNWRKLLYECPIIQEKDRAYRLLVQSLGPHTRSIVVEPIYVCKDHRNLFSNFYSKKFSWAHGVCSRLHFFQSSEIDEEHFLAGDNLLQESYIGYCVIRPIPSRFLGKIIIDPAKIGLSYRDGCFCLRTPFDVNLYGHRLIVQAFPHLSQDTDVTVCAHSALWSICRYLSERYSKYPELLPFDLIDRTPADAGRRFPYRGMVAQHYASILDSFGCFPLLFPTKNFRLPPLKPGELADNEKRRKQFENEEFKDFYSYLESGFPILASIYVASADGGSHAVCVMGHTIDYDVDLAQEAIHTSVIVPKFGTEVERKFTMIDSSTFVKAFVVSDDNTFPYQMLGKTGKSYAENAELYEPPGFSMEEIQFVACPLPEKVFLTASRARKVMTSILGSYMAIYRGDFARLVEDGGEIVSRMFVTTGVAFKRRKLENYRKQRRMTCSVSVWTCTYLTSYGSWSYRVSPNTKAGELAPRFLSMQPRTSWKTPHFTRGLAIESFLR